MGSRVVRLSDSPPSRFFIPSDRVSRSRGARVPARLLSVRSECAAPPAMSGEGLAVQKSSRSAAPAPATKQKKQRIDGPGLNNDDDDDDDEHGADFFFEI